MDQEYYSTLYNWFEKCGIISNIRTHLRENLIHALKSKDTGLKNDGPKCAKQYVYDLLIAEYLFNHNYAYTLSVFASEAPLLINFSNKAVQRSDSNDRGNNNGKLESDYVSHALETLGINPRDAKGRYVVSLYVESDMPLLLCILKCITMFSYNLRDDVPINEKVSLCNESTQTDFSWQSYNVQLEKLTALKRKVTAHKRTVDNKLRERETMLKEQAVLVERQLETLNAKLHQAQNVMHNMSLKEKQLREEKEGSEQEILRKQFELTVKERLLAREADRLQREKDNCKTLEENLTKMRKQKGVQVGLPAETSTQSLRNIEVQTDFVNDILQKEQIDVLTKEKEELNVLIQDQQLRIEQITQRAVQLSRQVEGIRSLRPVNVDGRTQTVNGNTIISESSSTEDILQDAKLRLKRLEEESLKADQYYYNFINNSP